MASRNVLASASRGTTTTGLFGTYGAASLIVVVDTTVGAGTSLIVKVQGYDTVSNKFYDLTDGTSVAQCMALTTTQTAVLALGLGVTVKAPANGATYQALSIVVPGRVRFVATVAGGNPTFSVGAEMVP